MTSALNHEAISTALHQVQERLAHASRQAGRDKVPRLVAVSKTKPASAVMAAYAAGQRHFGENYVQELVRKSQEVEGNIHWHFIGALQSNKAKALIGVKGLWMVETVERRKTADVLNKAVIAVGKQGLKVMIQVNTSGEVSKSGCRPDEAADLAKYVMEECKALSLAGLMTIGKPDSSETPEAFEMLRATRRTVASSLGIEERSLELSMGMSSDFEAATRMGSTSVRLGSTIFGARDYPKK